MNISPLDIRKHEFRKALRGFDPDEVLAFLDMMSIEFENLIRENAMLGEKVSNYTEQLKKYRDIESTLQETLLSAQRAREETIKTAKKQADVIIREAEVKAAAIIEDGRNKLSNLNSIFTEIKIQKDAYLAKLKALVNAQLEMIEKVTFSEEETSKKNNSATRNKVEIASRPEIPESTVQGLNDFLSDTEIAPEEDLGNER